MMKSLLVKSLPHLVAVIIFASLSAWYFSPVLGDFELRQGDISQFLGMSKEIRDFRAIEGEEPLWTNGPFGGMPAYQVSVVHSSNLMSYADKAMKLFLPGPIGILFLCMIGFYILGLCMRINPWLCIVGGLAFGFATINILYLGAGHNSKVHAIAYMAPTLGAVLLAFRGKLLTGAILTAFFFSLQLTANHPQMTYYLLILLFFVGISQVAEMVMNKQVPDMLKRVGVLLAAGLIAILPTMSNIMLTKEYSEESTRGKTELTVDADGAAMDIQGSEGLNPDYMLEYSLGKGEVFSMFIPNVKGGQSGIFGKDRELTKDSPREYRQILEYGLKYWGSQDFTGGAFYFGAAMLLLFLLGMVLSKGTLRWAFLAMTIVAIILSWKELTGLQQFFMDNVPLYTKFRDTKMILVTVQIIFPLMGMLAIDRLINDQELTPKLKKIALGTTGFVVVLFILWTVKPTAFFDFNNPGDAGHYTSVLQQAGLTDFSMVDDLIDETEKMRVTVFKKDMQRSVMILLLVAAMFVLLILRKIDLKIAVPVLGIILLFDLVSVDLRYLNKDAKGRTMVHFENTWEKRYPFSPTTADMSVLDREATKIEGFDESAAKIRTAKSKDFIGKKPSNSQAILDAEVFGALNLQSNYRVYQLVTPEGGFSNPTQDGRTSFFHKSLGGYHGAKMKRYQEMLDFHIMDEIQEFVSIANTMGPQAAFSRLPILNMFNTRYMIVDHGNAALFNPYSNGNAWFVDSIKWVGNADEEILKIGQINTAKSATVDERFRESLDLSIQKDSSAYIEMLTYKPNELTYQSQAKSDQLAVFSEVFYDKGWNAYIDDQLVEHVRVNYLLRGLKVPAGEHGITFKFEPQSWKTGSTIGLIGSVLVLAGMVYMFFLWYKDESAEKLA